MHIEHNLDIEKPIIDQLVGFGVAVNLISPKAEDFCYKYAELNQEHKDCIWGMACAIDSLANFEDNRQEDIKLGEGTVTIKKIQDEFEENVINRAHFWLVMEMCETLIAFRDDEICTSEDFGE